MNHNIQTLPSGGHIYIYIQSFLTTAVIILHPWGVLWPEKLVCRLTHHTVTNKAMYKNINSPLCFVLDIRTNGRGTERNVRNGIKPGTMRLLGTFCGEFWLGPQCQTETTPANQHLVQSSLRLCSWIRKEERSQTLTLKTLEGEQRRINHEVPSEQTGYNRRQHCRVLVTSCEVDMMGGWRRSLFSTRKPQLSIT